MMVKAAWSPINDLEMTTHECGAKRLVDKDACRRCTEDRTLCIVYVDNLLDVLPLEPALRRGVGFAERGYYVLGDECEQRMVRGVFERRKRVSWIRAMGGRAVRNWV